jgi:hypothetical protein
MNGTPNLTMQHPGSILDSGALGSTFDNDQAIADYVHALEVGLPNWTQSTS